MTDWTDFVPEKVKAPEVAYGGIVVHSVPLPDPEKLDAQELSDLLKKITPLKIEHTLSQTYHHSHGQDTPFFAGLSNGILLGTYCPREDCGRVYVTPRGHCMYDGEETGWVQIKGPGVMHTYALCYQAGEAYQDLTPFPLIYVGFENIALPDGRLAPQAENLLLSRLVLPEAIIAEIRDSQETKDFSVIEDVFRIGMPVFPRFKRLAQQDISDLYFVRGVEKE